MFFNRLSSFYKSFNSSAQVCLFHIHKVLILELQEADEPVTDYLLQHWHFSFTLIQGV